MTATGPADDAAALVDIYNFYGTVNSSGVTNWNWSEHNDTYYDQIAAWRASRAGFSTNFRSRRSSAAR